MAMVYEGTASLGRFWGYRVCFPFASVQRDFLGQKTCLVSSLYCQNSARSRTNTSYRALVSLGALITIASMGFGPFTQQAISFQERRIASGNSTISTLGNITRASLQGENPDDYNGGLFFLLLIFINDIRG